MLFKHRFSKSSSDFLSNHNSFQKLILLRKSNDYFQIKKLVVGDQIKRLNVKPLKNENSAHIIVVVKPVNMVL
jgi:hypothetical protein